MIRFPYLEIQVSPSPSGKKRKILRPIIPIILIYGKAIVGYEALIDSGADYNIFDAQVAEYLGIRLTSGNKRQIFGLGGQKIKGYEHTLELKIGDRRYETSIIFSKEIVPNSFGVLGNKGSFDHFEVNFNYKRGIIKLN